MILGKNNGYKNISSEQSCQTLLLDAEELHITGYSKNIAKKWIFYCLSAVLCGIPILILNWYPQLIFLKHTKSSLKTCNCILIRDSSNGCHVCSILTVDIPLKETSASFQKKLLSALKIENEMKYFVYKDIKYVWLDEEMMFQELRGWDNGVKTVKQLEESSGFTAEEQRIMLKIYGKNEMKISVPSSWKIFTEEILQPFYLFQFSSVILWFFNDYISYAICVIILSAFSIGVTLYTTKKQRKSLQCLAQKSLPSKVLVVRRGGAIQEIHPSLLVPGDVIQIPRNGCVMACDALLLKGHCIANEYILTGESSPITKTPPTVSDKYFNSIILKRNVLFCGTQILQTRYYGKGMVMAVTVSTGFSTMKGELIRCLLHPKPLGFKFYQDSVKFVFCLFFIATCGITYLWNIFFIRHFTLQKALVLDSLDLITIVVPPALPAALSAGVAYSRSRLLSKGIYCISPPKINVFGKLKLMCFDKTGTLTEEGLDLWGVVACEDKRFGPLISKPTELRPKHPLVIALATCHSLTIIEGNITGDPLDLSVFKSLDWELNEPGIDTCRYDLLCPTVVKPRLLTKARENGDGDWIEDGNFVVVDSELPYEIGIVREFPFTSTSRCMSVITRRLGANHMNLYSKGAPEKIWELCLPDSLPENFNEELHLYTSMGFRVIGVAYKQFGHKFTWKKSQRVKREDVENELIFLGLVVMQNKLKAASQSVVNDLRKANIRSVMITGDNLLTAVSVSRECAMVLPGDVIIEVKVTSSTGTKCTPTLSFHPIEPTNSLGQMKFSKPPSHEISLSMHSPDCHYAMNGKTWELLKTHFPHLVAKIIVKGTIFARMLPEQKTQLVEAFQDLDYIVGMCGDGTNDYGAMKAAHVGVSLSEAESSVVAPFTSKVQDVSCITTLVQEGRCALMSTFVIFKYMTLYSLIQFMSVLILYEKGVAFGNVEFLYVDLVVTSLLALVIGRAGPSKAIVNTRPIARLMSTANLFPLLLQVALLLSIQISALKFLRAQHWFVPVVPSQEAVTTCWENSVIYCLSLFQYLTVALVYSKGKPYRRPFYSDVLFMVMFIAMTAFAVLLCVWPFRSMAEFFEILPADEDTQVQSLFRLKLLLFVLVNLLLSFLIETQIKILKRDFSLSFRRKSTYKALFLQNKFSTNQKRLKKVARFLIKKKHSKNLYKRILMDSAAHSAHSYPNMSN